LEAEATARCATLEKKYAALEENLSTTVCNLIACGADVNAQNKRGETPFHIALKQNPILTHTLLTKCKHVINPNIRDGRTKLLPLEYAMSDPEDPELTKNLLQCGADIKIILKPETDGESVASRFHSLSLPMKAVVTGYFAQLPKDQRDELCSSLMEKKNTAKKEDAAENKNDGNAAEAEEISPFVAQVVKGKTMDQTIKEKSDKLYRQSEDPEGAIQNKNPIIVGTQTGEGKRDNDKKSELFDKYDSDKYDSDED
jgi:hypothetical protein